MGTASRPRASLDVTRKDAPGVAGRAQIMYNAFTAAAATFVSPTVAMSVFLALLTALVVAQQNATGTKAKGLATLRNTKRDALWTAMESLRAYVQAMADSLTAEGSASLIELAGLVVAGSPAHTKALLTPTLTTTPGTVHLDAYRSVLVGTATRKKVLFNWQMSLDGKTWTDLHATAYANTDVVGLTLMTTYSFRVSVTIGKTVGAWSQAVSIVVH